MHPRTLSLLRLTGNTFIWLGLAVGVVSLALRVVDLQSFSDLLFAVGDMIRTTAQTVGFGVLLLLLAEIVYLLQKREALVSAGRLEAKNSTDSPFQPAPER